MDLEFMHDIKGNEGVTPKDMKIRLIRESAFQNEVRGFVKRLLIESIFVLILLVIK